MLSVVVGWKSAVGRLLGPNSSAQHHARGWGGGQTGGEGSRRKRSGAEWATKGDEVDGGGEVVVVCGVGYEYS